MSDQKYDVIIIGGGPGGYVAAIRAAQLGLKTACVEKRGTLGGTCLNVGCLPSKALLQSSEKFHEAKESFTDHGIHLNDLKIDVKAMISRKNDIVSKLVKGIEGLFKKNKVDYYQAAGKILEANKVEITPLDGSEAQVLDSTYIIIATGSEVTPLPTVAIDEKVILSSTGALDLEKIPEHLVVIGGGVIGLEMGSIWKRLGAKVTVVEFLDKITPTMDQDVSKEFLKVLKKQGLEFKLGHKVTAAEVKGEKATLSVEPAKGGETETIDCDNVLVAIGRRPYVDGLGLDAVGVKRNDRGFIEVDEFFETSVEGIYAIGDCIPGPMLAHKAEEDGVACVEMLAGQAGHVDYNLVPSIVYTWPEVASVGKTEQELKDASIAYSVGKFPFMANSRARATGESDGFVKILADKTTDRVLGVHILGPNAGDMIHECAMAMAFGGSSEDIARTCHGHPTYNEAVKEAALAVAKRTINL